MPAAPARFNLTRRADAHYSLHVWSRKGGQWKLVATSKTPIETNK